jgi:hypothetical protein
MENVYLIDPGAFHEGPAHKLLPRGKFTAWYRLASSYSSQAPAWVCPQINVPRQLADQKSLNYYLLMFLESYANNGRWGYYWAPGLDEKARLATTVPEAIKDYTRFILDHRSHYEACQTANDILVVYADSAVFANPKGHFKYLALAQALAEVNYQYDAAYAGDDLFAPGDLDRDALDRYRIVLLPEAGHLTDQQIRVLSSYAEAGGQVVVYSESALKGRPGVATVADERLLDFWRDYRDEDRERAVAPLVDLGHDPVRVSDPAVNVICYAKGKTRILHLLNYDYREADDSIEAKHEVEIDIPWQEAAAPDVVWATLEGEDRLQSRVDGERLVFTVPKVDPYGLVIIG